MTNTLENIITPVVEGLGYEPIRILLSGNVRQTLQVMIDIKDGSRDINVADCATVSRALSKVLDEKDPIKNEYSLEVSSPGIDRPLTKPHHFARFEGYEAKLETIDTVDSRKRFKGKLLGVDGNVVQIDFEGQKQNIDFSIINKAKLVLTDELVAQLLKGKK